MYDTLVQIQTQIGPFIPNIFRFAMLILPVLFIAYIQIDSESESVKNDVKPKA